MRRRSKRLRNNCKRWWRIIVQKSMDGIHDLLLRLGDLTRAELVRRSVGVDVEAVVTKLIRARRVMEIQMPGEKRLIAIEDAAKFRDALGIPLQPGIPKAFLEAVPELAIGNLETICAHSRTVYGGGCGGTLWMESADGAERVARTGPCGTVSGRRFPAWRAFIVNGAMPKCCERFGANPWRVCAIKWNQSSSTHWREWPRIGMDACIAVADWMPCWTRSTNCKARRYPLR